MDDFAAIDFETANRRPASICSAGVVVVRGGAITATVYRLIRPRPNFYSYWNTDIHGLDIDDTAEAPTFPEVWAEISQLIDGLPLVAHNSAFDESCLRAAYSIYGMEYPEYIFYCTCRASRKLHPGLPNHKLPTVAAYVGYDFKNHHHALADAEACAHIALKIL